MPQSAILVDKKDNVATALRQLEEGNSIQVKLENFAIDVTSRQTIPFGHQFALKNIELVEAIIKYDEVIGLDKLYAFHLNDSKKDLGSRVDRHEHIGQGFLGLEPFRFLLNDERFKSHPMSLETPKDDDMDLENLKILRSLKNHN